jgi:hypothetical protein
MFYSLIAFHFLSSAQVHIFFVKFDVFRHSSYAYSYSVGLKRVVSVFLLINTTSFSEICSVYFIRWPARKQNCSVGLMLKLRPCISDIVERCDPTGHLKIKKEQISETLIRLIGL